ncbi:Peptidase G1 [Rhypophila sp. PSN 637]
MKFTSILGVAAALVSTTVLAAPTRATHLVKRNEQLTDWAAWTVPDVDEQAVNPASVSMWVGFDGYNEGQLLPLVQAGVDVIVLPADEDGDVEVEYRTWTQWLPDGNNFITDSFSFTPGDTVTIQLTTSKDSTSATAIFTLNGGEASHTQEFAPRDSNNKVHAQTVEWVVERILDSDGQGQLAKFDTPITFTDCFASTEGEGGAANTTPANGVAIDMLATGSDDLSASTVVNGAGLTVTWHRA